MRVLAIGVLVGLGCSLRTPLSMGPDQDLVALAARLAEPAGDATEPCARVAARAAEPAFCAALSGQLLDAQTVPETWRACVREIQIVATPSPALLRALTPVYLHLLSDGALEADPRRQAQLAAMHAALWDRPSGWAFDAKDRSALRAQLDVPRSSPAARQAAEDARAAADMEAGQYQGAAVDAGAIEKLAAARAEPALRRLSLRLPDPNQRQNARRALVRVRIAASSDPALAAAGDKLVEAVLASGVNSVPVEGLRRASYDGAKLGIRTITVRQDLERQRAFLKAEGQDRPFPPIPLRGPLQVWLGDETPLTLCGDPEDLDPSPCVAPEAVSVGNRLASYQKRRQAVVVGPEISARELPPLAAAGELDIGLKVGTEPLSELRWPVRFERPDDLVLAGKSRGPDLAVDVQAAPERPLVFRVREGAREIVAVVERADLDKFHVVSRGARGEPGQPGRRGGDGEDGQDGIDERCGPRGYPTPAERGGDGKPGEPGGPGGAGGHGGFIRVRLACQGDDCEALATTLRSVARSEGGDGGPGGAGGKGGAGGQGGVFGHCIDSARNAMEGRADSGKDGPSGRPGAPGRAGLPGSVSVELAQ
jgi:hypothetical protein